MTKRQEQLSISGTEPVEIPEVRDALYQWLDSKESRATASEKVRMSHDVLMARMVEAGVDRYAYNDSVSGKRKHVVADKTPKAKTINAPIASDKGRRGREKDVELDTPKPETVEMRRVSRKSVEAEIDGFAAVRASMNGGETVQ